MKQKTAEEMRPLIQSFAKYTGTKKAFCLENNINIHTFHYWQTKFNKQAVKFSSKKFLPLQVSNSVGSKIELYYPNGLRLVMPVDTPLNILQALVKTAG